MSRFMAATQEEFLMLVLNTKNRLQKEVAISKGTLNYSIVHPRDVFREAIRESGHGVIFVHNHPSGDPMGVHLEGGPDGGVVHLDDTRIFDLATRIMNEQQYATA